MSSQNLNVLLNRHLSLKEISPLSLVIDSLAQSAHPLIQEFVYKSEAPVILLSFESKIKPAWATYFLDCSEASQLSINSFVSEKSNKTRKSLVIIESLNYVPLDEITSFFTNLLRPNNTTLGIFHSNCPQIIPENYPPGLTLLNYMALSVFHIEPLKVPDEEELETSLARLIIPPNSYSNSSSFKLNFTNKRKSGKSLLHTFSVNLELHEYELITEASSTEISELFDDLTTFNLNTSNKQKIAKELVELPFMEAQAELGKMGGAIVYQFEKDDDYDEEDPYEDPF